VRVFAVAALWAAGYELCVVALPGLCARFGRAELTGLEVAFISVGAMAGGLTYGAKLVSSSHRRHDLAVSLALYGACLVALALTPGALATSVIAFAAGVSSSAVLTLVYLWAGGLAPRGAGATTYTAVSGSTALGGAGGSALGGALASGLGLAAPFVCAGALCVLAALIAAQAPPDEGLAVEPAVA
jgi:predicted MFS family arabinose efflux permease